MINFFVFIYCAAYLITLTASWCLKQIIRQGESTPIRSVDFSPAAADFVAVGRQEGVYIYNQTTFQLLGGIINSGQTVESVSFSKAANLFAIGYKNQNDIRVYSTASFPFTQKSYSPYNIGHRGLGIDFRNDGTKLLACGNKNDATIVSGIGGGAPTKTGAGFSSIGSPGTTAQDCQYGNSNQIGVTWSSKTVVMNSGGSQVTDYSKNCNAIDFKPGGNPIIGCTDFNGYEPLTGTNLGSSFMLDSGNLNTVAYAPDGNLFFIGGASKIAFLYYSNKTLMSKFPNLDSVIVTSRFDSASQNLLVGTTGGYLYLFKKFCQFTCESAQFYQNKTCYLCHNYLPFCTECTTSTVCVSCFTGYSLVAGKCKACNQTGCVSCSSDNLTCLACDMGYFLNTVTNKCQRCSVTLTYCKACNASNYCLACDQMAYFQTPSNKCVLCSTNLSRCLVCQNSSKCISCEIGFYTNSTFQCQKCPDYCTSCIINQQCNQCVRGYYVSASPGPYPANNNCLRCSTTGCTNCNNNNICMECEEGKYLNPSKNCIQCIFPCSACNDTNKCYSCINGYFLNTATSLCIACDSGCETCNQTGTCLTCYQGFVIDALNKCVKCSKTYANCSVCSQTACLFCSQMYYLDTGICTSCSKSIKYCLSCNTSTNCYECVQGYYQTGSSGNLSCQICGNGCAKCINSSQCQSCLSGFYFATGTCLNCVAPCITCIDSTQCLSCSYGHYLNTVSHLCIKCHSGISNCMQCYNSSYCVGCQIGFYLNPAKSACIRCVDNCTSCNGSSYCHTCENGYYLGGVNTCIKCSTQCSVCQSSTICSKCLSGYYLETDFSCKKCSLKNCINCQAASICTECSSQTFLDQTPASLTYKTCKLCKQVITNCIECNKLQECSLCVYGFGISTNKLECKSCAQNIQGCIHCQKINNCLSCQKQFFISDINLDGNSECSYCPKGCQSCSSTVCTSCVQAYFLNSAGACLTCQQSIEGCNECQNSTGTLQCSKCQRQYYRLSSTQCSLCNKVIAGCFYCTNSSYCQICESGFYFNQTSFKCDKCSSKLNACELCSSYNVCQECQNNFYLDSTLNICLPCFNNSNNCLSCYNQSYCQKCQSRAYLQTITHSCVLCQISLKGCISCLSNTVCLQCDSGYFLNSSTNQCQLCSQKGCEICEQQNSTKCVTCNSLYILQSVTQSCKHCQTLITGCIDCSNSTGTPKCTTCLVGYFKNTTSKCQVCSKKIQGCIRCSDVNNCLECQSLYLLETSKLCKLCSSYMPHCQICNSNNTCLACSISFFLTPDTRSCKFCPQVIDNCIYCQSSSICVMCEPSYFIKNGNCSKCSQYITGCYTCLGETSCTSCKNGYVFNPTSLSCQIISVMSAQQPLQTLKMITYYESKTILRHVLFSSTMKFNKDSSQTINLISDIAISLQDKQAKQYPLKIWSYSFSTDLYSIVFYTDNPFDFQTLLSQSKSQFQMSFRRLLATPLSKLNIQSNMEMSLLVAQTLLPQLDYSSDVKINYGLSQPEFYSSLIQNVSIFQSKYYIFGYIILSILFINFAIKTLFTAPQNFQKAQIISHIIALKSVCTSIYPSYYEMTSFGRGFMLFDLPWLNNLIGPAVGNQFDYAPSGFKTFYTNLNIGSTFLLSLMFIIILLIIKVFFISEFGSQKNYEVQNKTQEQSSQKNSRVFYDKKLSHYTVFWFHIFGYGLVQAGICSFLGAINNHFNQIGINFFFYLLGSLIYFGLALKLIYLLYIDFYSNLNILRVFLKSSILSLAFLSPIYMVSLSFLLDITLLILHYKNFHNKIQSKNDKNISYLFYINHFSVNLSLLIVYLINSNLFALIGSCILISLCTLLQLGIHFKQYFSKPKNYDQFKKANQLGIVFTQDGQNQVQQGMGSFKNQTSNKDRTMTTFTSQSNGVNKFKNRRHSRNKSNTSNLDQNKLFSKNYLNYDFFNNL